VDDSQFVDCDSPARTVLYEQSGTTLIATTDPAERSVVTLDRDSAASTISAIISVGTISGSIIVSVVSIIVSVVTVVRAHSYAAERGINGNLS